MVPTKHFKILRKYIKTLEGKIREVMDNVGIIVFNRKYWRKH